MHVGENPSIEGVDGNAGECRHAEDDNGVNDSLVRSFANTDMQNEDLEFNGDEIDNELEIDDFDIDDEDFDTDNETDEEIDYDESSLGQYYMGYDEFWFDHDDSWMFCEDTSGFHGVLNPQGHLRRELDILANCVNNGNVILYGIDRVGDRRHYITDPDEQTLLHWKNFADSTSWKHPGIEVFKISNIVVTRTMLNMVLPGLAKTNVNRISLENNRLKNDGFLLLTKFLEENTSLGKLHISGNKIEDLDILTRLSLAVRKHPSLKALYITECELRCNENILSNFISPPLEIIHFGRNKLGSESAPVITRFLAMNPPLKQLHLQENEFNDEDAPLFAHALRNNTNLQRLILYDNRMTEASDRIFIKSVFDATCMNSISDSNHSCYIILDNPIEFIDLKCSSSSSKVEILDMNLLSNHKENRKKKIIFALHDSLLWQANSKYFEDFPLELIPNVLSLIQQHPESEVKNLTKCFEILKRWNMPALFRFVASLEIPSSPI